MERKWGGTISAKMGLLQAGAAQLIKTPMQPSTAAYNAAVPLSPSSGKPYKVLPGTSNAKVRSLVARLSRYPMHAGMSRIEGLTAV